ncbi:MAG: hypothetical protein IJC49_02690 [Clostridia bacterium]|nr:hypothetical protein [Clostridia bacterium]
MKSINVILLGIALILFGGVSVLINAAYDIGEFMEILSVFSSFLGIIISVIGAFKND